MDRRCVAVAVSGGLDSTALLHATVAAAEPLGVRVAALHVHHGLSVHADAWADHVRALCARWARRGRPLAFDLRRLDGRPARGDSVEAWARQARYRALREMADAAGADLVLLAHHRRDQAETFLLQALRAAGASGLASMPRSAVDGGLTWARPWLDVPRTAIEAYARRHRLRHLDDDSNADRRHARNRLRLDVWPTLTAAFPDAEATLATAARLAGDARSVLDAAATADLAAVAREADGALDLVAWSGLPAARRRLALAAWLRGRLGQAAPRTLVDRLDRELERTHASRWPAPGGTLRRHRRALLFDPGRGEAGR